MRARSRIADPSFRAAISAPFGHPSGASGLAPCRNRSLNASRYLLLERRVQRRGCRRAPGYSDPRRLEHLLHTCQSATAKLRLTIDATPDAIDGHVLRRGADDLVEVGAEPDQVRDDVRIAPPAGREQRSRSCALLQKVPRQPIVLCFGNGIPRKRDAG